MKIFITGGSGFVGNFLAKRLAGKGHEVTILTRKVKKGRFFPEGVSLLEGNPTKPGKWQENVAEHETIINLAGATIFTFWTQKAKRQILNSRILTTNYVVEALSHRKVKETLLLNASGVGYYGFHGDEELCENDQKGDDFLAQVASTWESVALKAKEYGVRVVLCRFGVVLGKQGGALAKLMPIYKWYLGAPLGSGKQWISWIHEVDLTNIFLFLLEHRTIEGPINCTSPNPIRNEELTKALGDILQKPTFFPAIPGFVLKVLLGEFAEVLLKGQRVMPKKILDNGYHFKFPDLSEALISLVRS